MHMPADMATTGADGPCSARPRPEQFVTWDELGLAPATAAVMAGSYRFFLAADGERFEEVSAPVPDGGEVIGDIKLVGFGGFAALTYQYDSTGDLSRSVLYGSIDGRSWNDLGEPPVSQPDWIAARSDQLLLSGSAGPAEGVLVAVREPSGE